MSAESDSLLASRGRPGFLESVDLLLAVVDPPRHPSVDRVRDHRDDELERRRQHRGRPRVPALGRLFKLTVRPQNRAKLDYTAWRPMMASRTSPLAAA
jgi:hypothetical protein